MTFYRNHTLNSPSTEMSHLISLYSSSALVFSVLQVFGKKRNLREAILLFTKARIIVFKTILQIT